MNLERALKRLRMSLYSFVKAGRSSAVYECKQ